MGVAPDSIKKGGWEDLESEPEATAVITAEEVKEIIETEEVPVTE